MKEKKRKKKSLLFRYSWIIFVSFVGLVIVKSEELQAFAESSLAKLFDQALILFSKETAEEDFVKNAGPKVCPKSLTLNFECAEPLGWYKNRENPECGEHKSKEDIVPPSIESFSKDDFIYWFGYCNGLDSEVSAKYGKNNRLHVLGKNVSPNSDKLEILDCIKDDDKINKKPGVPKVFPAMTRKYAAFGIVSRHKGNYDFFSKDEDVRRTRNIVWTVTPRAPGGTLKTVNTTGSNTSFVCTRPMFRRK